MIIQLRELASSDLVFTG